MKTKYTLTQPLRVYVNAEGQRHTCNNLEEAINTIKQLAREGNMSIQLYNFSERLDRTNQQPQAKRIMPYGGDTWSDAN